MVYLYVDQKKKKCTFTKWRTSSIIKVNELLLKKVNYLHESKFDKNLTVICWALFIGPKRPVDYESNLPTNWEYVGASQWRDDDI